MAIGRPDQAQQAGCWEGTDKTQLTQRINSRELEEEAFADTKEGLTGMAKCPDERLPPVGRAALNTPHLERTELKAVSQPRKRRAHGRGPAQQASGTGQCHPRARGQDLRGLAILKVQVLRRKSIGQRRDLREQAENTGAQTPRVWMILRKPLPVSGKRGLTHVI